MANPTDRQSLTLNMEDRYKKSKAGGAFDAKSAGGTGGIPNDVDKKCVALDMEDRYKKCTAGGAFDAKSAGKTFTDGIPNDFADGFTKGGANTGLPKKDSMFLKGHNTQKYKV